MVGQSAMVQGQGCQDGPEEGNGQFRSSQTPALMALGLLLGSGRRIYTCTLTYTYTQGHTLTLANAHSYPH